MTEYEKIYAEAMRAEENWTEALTRQFGAKAGEARYDQRGKSTSELASLEATRRIAMTRLHSEWDKGRIY